MTDKQTVFVQEYLKDMNATQAAKRAGYSQHTASAIGAENLTKPEIKQAIDTAMNERAERTELTQDYVLHSLQEIAERCMQKRPVMFKGVQAVDDDGNHLWTFDARSAIRALELLGRHLKMFSDKIEIQTENSDDLRTIAIIRTELLRQEQERDNAHNEAQNGGM